MSATWTNEPSGATNRLDHNFNVALGSGMSDYYHSINGQNPNDQLVDLNEAWQVSPTKCYRSRIEVGAVHGGTELSWAAGGLVQSLFVGIAWRTNPEFIGRPVGNKMFFIRGPGANAAFTFGNSSLSNGSAPMIWNPNTGGLDNSHITGSTDPSIPFFPNVGNGTLTRGVGFKIEAYIKKSTSNTSRDGIVKWWINGLPVGSYTNVNYAGDGLNEWVWTEAWDGTPINTSVAWEHYLDHLYISTGGTLGSQPPPPPPPDPTPTPQVVLSSLTPANQSTVVGTSRQFTISMSGPMLTATSLFTTSSNTSVATVPASVTIAAGASTALVTATPVAVGSTSISTSYNGVTKAATLQVGSSGSTSGSTAYDYSAQFSGTQGQDNWYYLEESGTEMTYNGGTAVWSGSDAYGVQTIWGTGFHPGRFAASVLRFVVPSSGTATIAGSYVDADTGGGTGCIAKVNLNGVTLFSRTINNGDTTGGTYNLTPSVAAGDYIEFVVSNQTGDYTYNSTSLNPVITLAATSAPPTPTPEPELPASLVDLFTTATSFRVGTPFTMTVRLSKIVSANTSVTIRVGSAAVLTAASSVTVLSGASEASFTVTPIASSLVAIEAELNGIKRVTLNVLPLPEEPPPEVEPGPATDPASPTTVIAIRPYADGAAITLSQGARELAFRYDAQPDWVTIPTYQPNLTTHVHRFTWPSGTTTICYRARALDGTWQESACAALPLPIPPPIPPVVNKSIIDKDGIRWQLTGKASPYILKRNGSSMDNTYGVLLRKSGDGYVEVLQTNGVWIRRKDNAWEFVS